MLNNVNLYYVKQWIKHARTRVSENPYSCIFYAVTDKCKAKVNSKIRGNDITVTAL